MVTKCMRWAFANFSAPSLLIAAVVVHTLGYPLSHRAGRDCGLRKTWGGNIAPRVAQHRFGLDGRAHDHRGLYPALLIAVA